MMNKITSEKRELELCGIPQKTSKRLLGLISMKNYNQNIRSKNELIKEGEKILPVIHALTKSDYKSIRKEAIKVVKQLAHESSIPVAIALLEDRENDIRRIAAETLIRIGRSSINPLLEALVDNGISYYLRQGVHHVLSELICENDRKELKQLVNIIGRSKSIPERITVKAADNVNERLLYDDKEIQLFHYMDPW